MNAAAAHNAAETRPLVTVMTRLRTVNIGNEALSNELLGITAASFPEQRVQALERAPRYLARYLARDLPRSLDRALAQFERWSAELEELGSAAPQIDFTNRPAPAVQLVLEAATTPWKGRLKKRLQLRRYAARLGLYDDEFGRRLAAHRQAQVAILNPAGEFNPQSIDPPLRMMLELRAAQRLGARAGIVNFSFEVADPFLTEFFVAVLSKFDFVSVRDHHTQAVLASAGLPAARVPVIGDLAFLTTPADPRRGAELAQRLGLTPETIALIVNGKFGGHTTVDDWSRLAHQLAPLSKNGELVMLSNELSSDLPFALALEKCAPVRVIREQFSYRDYAALLKHLRLVVSNRLHTAVLALVAGTPVVAIELIARRIKGVMEEMQYPIPVPLTSDKDWIDATVAAAHQALSEEVSLRARIPELVRSKRQLIGCDMQALLRATDRTAF